MCTTLLCAHHVILLIVHSFWYRDHMVFITTGSSWYSLEGDVIVSLCDHCARKFITSLKVNVTFN